MHANQVTKHVHTCQIHAAQPCWHVHPKWPARVPVHILMLSMQAEGLAVTDVVVLIDREQGGEAHLLKNGLALHAAFKLSMLLKVRQSSVW